jgi:hypothetical protein
MNQAHSQNLEEYKARLQKEWASIPLETIRALYKGLPSRIDAVVSQNGGAIAK